MINGPLWTDRKLYKAHSSLRHLPPLFLLLPRSQTLDLCNPRLLRAAPARSQSLLLCLALRSLLHLSMGKAHAKKTGEKSIMDNPEYAAMKAAKQIWLVSLAHTSDLQELADLGLIQSQDLAKWKEAGEHRVPVLRLGEIIIFVSFIRAGLCLPASPFLHRFLQFNSIS